MKCDVLIIGGGPAGLAAAIALRQKGVDVLVADALQPPIDKACGEGLMPDSLDVLARLGVAIPDLAGARFDGIAFLSKHSSAVAHFRDGRGIGIRRPRLHQLLRDRAEELGVRCAWSSRVLLGNGGGAHTRLSPVHVNNEECHFGLLVGADGQQSTVRRLSGLDEGSSMIRRFGRRRHFRIPVSGAGSLVEVYWGELGQAYVTPVAPDEIGVAAISRSPRATMTDVLRDLPRLTHKLEGAVAVTSVRGSITTTRRLHRVTQGELGGGGVALIGDASGSADAVTGEGLALAFRQALLLAGAVERGSLASYEAGHPAILRQPRIMARVLLAMDRFPGVRNRALNVLAADAELFSRLLALHVGDRSATSVTWKDALRIGWSVVRSSR